MIPEDALAINSKISSDANFDVLFLGLPRHLVEDVFYFNIQELDCPTELTKRLVLSKIAK